MTNQAWLDQVKEEIIDPDRPIIDPHHHLWDYEENVYLYEELHQDTGSGHNIVKTVFVECGSEYLTSGPEEFRPVGETAFVVEQAKGARAAQGQAEIAGIVSHVNLMLGDRVDEILDRHAEAGQGLFRGIRHSAAFDPSPEIRKSHSGAPEGLYLRDDFRAGFACLGRRGLTFDAWNYHPQISELTSLARAIPETTIIFDHFGGPIGIGPYEGKRGAIFTQWKDDISQLASLPNVVARHARQWVGMAQSGYTRDIRRNCDRAQALVSGNY